MSFYKNGIATTPEFDESPSHLIFDNTLSYKFTPAKDTTNSTFNSWWVDFADYISEGADKTFRIMVDVSFTGFDSSSTAGTFNIYWQGDNYKIATNGGAWEGSNYVTATLNSQQNLTALVNGKTGSYTYNTTFTIPASWFSTYSRSRLGIRSNYSNGIGNITVGNVRVCPVEYSAGGVLSLFTKTILLHRSYMRYELL